VNASHASNTNSAWRQLVGSAMNADWLDRLWELTGKLHVWTVEKAKSGEEPEPGWKDG
jgi:hypothetical protein